jgi:ABC-2 type transport system ATP-binding protein
MVIETHGLTKEYRRTLAVESLDLAIPDGSISAFLGPNGSGKTTTIKMLLGLARPTAGNALVFGQPACDDVASVTIRRRTGYVGEDKRLYGYMTLGQILSFVQSAYPKWDIDRAQALVRQFDLPLDRKCKKLSKGMRTKLALVLALSRGAELLILDEPSEGLDPVAAEQLLEAVVRAAAEGATVFFSTHQISEVERIADHVFIMNQGHLVFESPIEEMRAHHRRIHVAFPGRVPVEEMSQAGAQRVRVQDHVLSFVVKDNVESITQRAHSLGALSVDIQPISLREVFLESVEGGRS